MLDAAVQGDLLKEVGIASAAAPAESDRLRPLVGASAAPRHSGKTVIGVCGHTQPGGSQGNDGRHRGGM